MGYTECQISRKDWRTACLVAHAIGSLDGLVFPDSGVTKIAIVPEKPKKSESYYGYVPPGVNDDGSGDYYQIFGIGIDEEIKHQLSTEKITLIKEKLPKRSAFDDSSSITLEELLLQIAGHEIRHRVGYLCKVSLFSWKMREQINDPYLKTLILYVHCLLLVNRPKENYRREFDAEVVEHLVAELWHRGEKDLAKIAEIVKAGARKMPEILKGTKLNK